MGFFSKWRIHKSVHDGQNVEVSEQDGVRLMHLGSDTVQSAMRVARPNDLELAYTRAMMAFLLFLPEPQRILMVGLGGGSLAKFVYHSLIQTHTTVVEINPQVVACAHSHFFLPPDDERLCVLQGDGAEFVATHPAGCDVLMLDGYDDKRQVESLAGLEFYRQCREALTVQGVLVVNLWGSDRRFSEYLQLIEQAFDGLTLCLPAEKRGNVIVFGFRQSPGMPRWSELKERARKLEAEFGLEFPRFVDNLSRMNLHNEKRLLV